MNLKNIDPKLSNIRVWTALITPLLPSGAIDFSTLEQLAQTQADAGNGILLLGSTGEGLSLSGDEQLAIVKRVCALALNTPLMVAVGGFNLPEQLKWIDTCNSLPIASFLLGSPIYAKPGPVGQKQWFSALLDAANHPCMLYNVPSRSGVSLGISALQALQNHENCWALKEASGELSQFLAYRQHCPDIALYSGEDAMMPYLAGANVQGLVSVCANVWPQATRRYVEMSLSNDIDSLFPLWQNAVDSLFQVASPIPVKVLMAEKKQIPNPNLRSPLTHSELASNNSLLTSDEQVSQWYQHNQLQPVQRECN